MKECKEFTRRLKSINTGLFCRWNGKFNRWQIMYKSDKTGLVKNVHYVTKKDSNLYGSGGDRLIDFVKNSVRWDLVAKYDLTNDMLDVIDKEEELEKKRKEADFDDYIMQVNKDEQFNWAKALGTKRIRIFQGA